MLLTSADGASVELRPTRHQYPDAVVDPFASSASWLEVEGTVRTADGKSWRFEQPCLQTVEAERLRDWLRSAAHDRVPVVEPPESFEDDEGVLTFTEPHIALSIAAHQGDHLVVRIRFSCECAPGWRGVDAETTCLVPPSRDVLLRLSHQDLLDAADAWQDDLALFPRR